MNSLYHLHLRRRQGVHACFVVMSLVWLSTTQMPIRTLAQSSPQRSAQSLILFEADASEFPTIKAKFFALDERGRPLTGLHREQFSVVENGTPRPITNVIIPDASAMKPVSAVLTVDVSGSMAEHNRLSMARQAAVAWVDAMNFDESECALSSFDDRAYLQQDFTRNPDKLFAAAQRLKPQDGTSYTNAFLDAAFGGLKLARRGKYKRVMVFLTDGLGGGKEEPIIQAALKDSVTVYCITLGMAMPAMLKRIADRTGGAWYEHVTDEEQLVGIYRKILHQAQNTPAGEIVWQSTSACTTLRDVRVTLTDNVSQQIASDSLSYQASPLSVIRLNASPRSVRFRDIPPGSSQGVRVTLTALHQPITVTALESNNPVFFVGATDVPFTLQPGEQRQIHVGFAPKDSSRQFARIDIVTSACAPTSLHLSGGYVGKGENRPSLALTFPNGGEVLAAGADTVIKWTGIMPSERVKLEYSLNGQEWREIASSASGGSYNWRVSSVLDEARRLAGIGSDTNRVISRVRLKVSQVWEPREQSSEPSLVFDAHAGSVLHADFSPDGSKIVTTSADKTARIWDANTGFSLATLPHKGTVMMAAFHPNGTRIVTVDEASSIRLWDAETGEHLLGITPTSASYSNPNASNIAETMRGGVRTTFSRSVYYAAFDPQGRNIATALDGGTITVWNAKTLAPVATYISEFAGKVNSVAFSPDGSRLLSCNAVGIQLWSGKWSLSAKADIPERAFTGHTDEVLHATFSPDGTRIVSGSADKTARVWNVKTGKAVLVLRGHKAAVVSAVFSPDGQRILTASFDGTFRIWDAQSGKELYQFAQPVEARNVLGVKGEMLTMNMLNHAVFSPDASRVLACGVDMVARVWDLGGGFLQQDTTDAPFTITHPLARIKPRIDMGETLRGFAKDSVIAGVLTNPNDQVIRVQDVQLLFTSTTASQEFSLVSGLPPFTVAPLASASLEVRFEPLEPFEQLAPSTTISGAIPANGNVAQSAIKPCLEHSAILQVVTQSDTLRALIVGTSRAVPFAAPLDVIDFGKVFLSQAKDSSVAVLTNISSEPLRIKRIEYIGADASEFSVLHADTALTLAPLASHRIQARFAPNKLGRASGGVAFTLEGVNKPVVVRFVGDGVRSPLEVSLPPAVALTAVSGLGTSANDDGEGQAIDTLAVEEFRATVRRPLLNYVFFDERSAAIPARYHRVQPLQTHDFSAQLDSGLLQKRARGLDVYYHVLNIVGKYLADRPQASLRLTGCNADAGSERGNIQLSRQRAEAVKAYLVKTWAIAEKRIKIQARNRPERPSNASSEDGLAENRRVEFVFESSESSNAFVMPMQTEELVVTAQPEVLRFRPTVQAQDSVKRWTLQLLVQGFVVKELSGSGTVPPHIDWFAARDPLSLPVTASAATVRRLRLVYRLRVEQHDGEVALSPVQSLPLRYTVQHRVQQSKQNSAITIVQRDSEQYERYALMFFDFDKTTISANNARMLEAIKRQIPPDAELTITGYTDRVGDGEYNRRLSEERARAVAEVLKKPKTSVVGFGEAPFLFANEFPEGRFYCRMVEITVKNRLTANNQQ